MLDYTTDIFHYASEVEVFSGFLLGQNGATTKQQREHSIDMSARQERNVSYTKQSIVWGLDGTSQDESLARSLACFFVGLTENRTRPKVGALVSFGWVAATVCLDEVNRLHSGNLTF